MNYMVVACIFDDCEEEADYSLEARWPDGGTWRRDVCLVHMVRGIQSLQNFRPPEAGRPTVLQRALID
jgi:hypothetical protein